MEMEIIREKKFVTDWNAYWVQLIREKYCRSFQLRVFDRPPPTFFDTREPIIEPRNFSARNQSFLQAAWKLVWELDEPTRLEAEWEEADSYVPPPSAPVRQEKKGEVEIIEDQPVEEQEQEQQQDDVILVHDWTDSDEKYYIPRI